MKKFLTAFLVILSIIVIGFLIPENYQMPCGTTSSYNHNSFWYHPWTRGVNGSPHYGVDIFAKEGTDAHPAVPGIVVFRGTIPIAGNAISILGPKWRLHSYFHMKDINVKIGQIVDKNTLIGHVGKTGNAATTPAHIHYQINTPFPYFWLYNQKMGICNPPEKFNWMKMFYLNPDSYLRKDS